MTLIQRILVPTDFSDCAKRAIDYATELCKSLSATLVVLHIYAPPTVYLPDGVWTLPATDADMRTELNSGLEKLATDLRAAGVRDVSTALVEGNAAHEIGRVAHDQHCDLIVMGTHGRSGVKHLLLGSVAEQVIRRADCAVLTVRPAAPSAA
jgi:nucleotide-binding universal stress UspA family protein